MITIKVIFLAILQGITEFLPISSSGHLAVCQNILGIKDESSVLLAVILHAGTLLSILIYYFKELIALLEKKNHRVILLIIIGTIPAGIFGILIKKAGFVDKIFTNMLIPGIGLLITASLLKWGMTRNEGTKEIRDLSFIQALTVGLYQAFAIFPGISRSGSTIIGSISQKLKRSEAATFSFMLAIPAIGGAAFIEILSYFKNPHSFGEQFPFFTLIIGFIISAVVGFFALKLLLRSLKKGSLTPYAYYCFTLGSIIILWQIIKYWI
jgi:undecaprenyl-diphosphatase